MKLFVIIVLDFYNHFFIDYLSMELKFCQILIFILLIYLLNYFKYKNIIIYIFLIISILFTALIISLKAFYFLYLLFIIPFIFFLKRKKIYFNYQIMFNLKGMHLFNISFVFLVIFSYFFVFVRISFIVLKT